MIVYCCIRAYYIELSGAKRSVVVRNALKIDGEQIGLPLREQTVIDATC